MTPLDLFFFVVAAVAGLIAAPFLIVFCLLVILAVVSAVCQVVLWAAREPRKRAR